MVSTELALLQSNMTFMYSRRGPQYHWVVELFRRLHLPVFDGVHAALESFNERRRLHYVVSTELALLQSNMTFMYSRRGPQYHWVVELFRRLHLPVFDGVHAALESFNERRMAELQRKKTSKYKNRRIQLLMERTVDAQRRKEWSKKHGHDTYGDDDSDEDGVELKSDGRKGQRSSTGGKCKACGSTTHRRSSHRDCPFNKNLEGTGYRHLFRSEGRCHSVHEQ